MKKRIAILVVLALVATGAFAQIEMSAGGGLLLDISGRNGLKAEEGGVKVYEGYKNTSFGGFIFFDATYAELDVSFAYGSLMGREKWEGGGYSSDESEKLGSALQLGFTLLGKYPIELGSITIFPLLGVSYNRVLSLKDDDTGYKYDDPGDLSQFGILAGVGLDYGLTDKLYLRGEALFQVRLPSKFAKDAKDVAEEVFKYMGATNIDVKNTLGMGVVVKVAVGYKF